MDLNLHNGSGSMHVSDAVFGADNRPALIHQVVTAYMAGARSGSKAQKNRAAVSGGGSKPFRQKGTGRARAGTSRSPIWRAGGVAFAAKPRAYAQKVNRKMYRGALRAILSELVRNERLIVVKDLGVSTPKTKELVEKLKQIGLDDVLIVIEKLDENMVLSARNLPKVDVVAEHEIDPVSLLAFEKVLITEGAVKKIGERLA